MATLPVSGGNYVANLSAGQSIVLDCEGKLADKNVVANGPAATSKYLHNIILSSSDGANNVDIICVEIINNVSTNYKDDANAALTAISNFASGDIPCSGRFNYYGTYYPVYKISLGSSNIYIYDTYGDSHRPTWSMMTCRFDGVQQLI